MIKAFLSHSSADKNRYVRTVAEKLGEGFAVFDELTFEAGMQPLEEIITGLNDSQVFVVFLSDNALSSKWVMKELNLAHKALSRNELQRIFPIIIDPSITYTDPRLPQWLKDQYNLKYVSRPTIAARRIKQRLREASWLKNPRLQEKHSIFVGRNDLISQIEIRVDDLDQRIPACFIASGLSRIGRKSLLRHALVKCNIAKQSYEFPSIFLSREDSLDDFLLKLFDLGLSAIDYPKNLMELPVEERIKIAEDIATDIHVARELVMIHDEGSIVNYTGTLRPWFDVFLNRVATNERPVFLISARYRLRPEHARDRPHIFHLSVPELNIHERNGLFKRLLELDQLSISRDDFGFFSGLFQGFPDQLLYAANLIRDNGVGDAKKRSHEITEFNSDKAATILAKYAEDEETTDLLYLLSQFEFISFDFLFSLVEEEHYSPVIEQLLSESVCDYVGIEREFLRLNDAIRDYVRRNRLEMPERFQAKLKSHLNSFLDNEDLEDRDMSDVLYSMKEGIKAGRAVPEAYLISSHFLTSMRELYQERGHLDRVIELADRLLEKRHLLEPVVEQDVRYYLCLSLARKKDARMLKEVQRINGAEHDFLLGFYYRLQGRANDAIERLEKCINDRVVANRAKRELVQVYLSIEDYESASDLARENYESNRRNAYHIQAYFNSVVNSTAATQNSELLEKLIGELKELGTDIALQMANIARADFLAKVRGDYQGAADAIDDAVAQYSEAHYPLISKAYLAVHQGDLGRLKAAHKELMQLSEKKAISEETLNKLKAYSMAMEGDLGGAISLAEKNLQRVPVSAKSSFIRKLNEAHRKFGGGSS